MLQKTKSAVLFVTATLLAASLAFGFVFMGGGASSVANADEGTTHVDYIDMTKQFTTSNIASYGSEKCIYLNVKSNMGWESGAVWHFERAKIGNDETVADYVLLGYGGESKSIKSWIDDKELSLTRIVKYGTAIGITLEENDSVITADNVNWITLKKGLAPDTKDSWGGEDYTGNDTEEQYALPVDVTLYLNHGSGYFEYGAYGLADGEVEDDALTVEGIADTYYKNDTISPDDLTATVKIYDGTTQTVSLTNSNISYSFTETGEKTVTITYGGATCTKNVTVSEPEKKLEGIALSEANLTVAQFSQPDFSSVDVTATFDNGSKIVMKASSCEITGYDSWTQGEQAVTVSYTYGGVTKTAELTLTVTDPDTSKGLTVNYSGKEVTNTTAQGRSSAGSAIVVVINSNYKTTQQKMLDNIEKLDGAHVADYIVINGETVTELIAETTVGGVYTLGEQLIVTFNSKYAVETVILKAGLEWVASDEDHWGNTSVNDYYTVADEVLKQDVGLYNENGTWVAAPASITATYTGGKIATGGVISSADVTVTATWYAGNAQDPTVSDYTLSYDSSTAGSITVTVSYRGQTATFSVTVTETKLTSIEIETAPTKTKYTFGDLKLDIEGLVLTLTYTTDDIASTESLSDLSEITTSGYDPYTEGEQTITVTYGSLSTTFTITVEMTDDYGIDLGWSNIISNDSTYTPNGANIDVGITMLGDLANTDMKAVILNGRETSVYDKVLINGKTLTYWIGTGAISWVGFYGTQFVVCIDVSNTILWVSTLEERTIGGETVYYSDEYELITTVKFLKGFQVYNSATGKDQWPADGVSETVPVEGACLKEDVLLYNDDGLGWQRVLKQTEDGEVAEGAIVISTPANKTEFTVGDLFTCTGLAITVYYEDGGSETILVSYDMLSGYNMKTAGEQTVTISYAGGTATYTITVSADNSSDNPVGPENPEEGAGGGNGGWIALGVILGVVVIAGAVTAVILVGKKKKKK